MTFLDDVLHTLGIWFQSWIWMAGDPAKHTPPTGLVGLLSNGPFVAALVSFLLAQLSKLFTFWYTERKWDYSRLVGSGGMPSSHTAFVVGLTSAVGVYHGTSSTLFALCVVVSLVVMYDASGVRLHAGRQASVLNLIISEMPADHPVQDGGRLRDTLGHTPLQVCVGALVGIVVGYIVAETYLAAGAHHPAPQAGAFL